MQVSKSLDYAVRSLTYIAKEKANVFTIRDISEKQHIPQNYLAKIMRKLVQKGLLSSSPGPEGGYSLRKSTDEISLKDVYEAIEGDMQLIDCMEKNVVCELFNSCSQRSVWDHLQLHTLNFLNDISVEDIAKTNLLSMESNTDFSFLNIGTGISTSIKELAELMIELSGKKLEISFDDLPLGDVKDSLADVSLAKKLINWNYETSLKNGLKKFFF